MIPQHYFRISKKCALTQNTCRCSIGTYVQISALGSCLNFVYPLGCGTVLGWIHCPDPEFLSFAFDFPSQTFLTFPNTPKIDMCLLSRDIVVQSMIQGDRRRDLAES